MARVLQDRLALAQFKTKHGWEDLDLAAIEPKVEKELKRKRPTSRDDFYSDSSSSVSDLYYPSALITSSSPPTGAIFSDSIYSSGGLHGRHQYNNRQGNYSYRGSGSSTRKRYRSTSNAVNALHSGRSSWKDVHHLPQSSPIRPRPHSHF